MRILLLFVLVAASSRAADLQIVTDFQGENVRYRALIGKLTNAEFVVLASEFLKSNEITVGAIAVYGSARERVLAGPLGGDHCGYDTRRATIESNDHRPGCPEVKEAIKIGSAMIVRTLNADCRRSSDLIQGDTNPLILDARGEKVEILHLSFSRPIGRSNLRRIGVQLYVRAASGGSVDAAKAITETFRTATRVRDLSVELRSDSWFFNDCQFPVQFPFEAQERTPTRAEWYKTTYAVCSTSEQWPIRCFASESRP